MIYGPVYSLASAMPPDVTANVASFSGRSGLSYILAILVSPLPFLKLIRVVEACASICPPIGFLGSA